MIRKKQRKIKNPFFKPIQNKIKPLATGGLVQLDIKYVWRKGRYYYQRTFLDVYSRKQFIHLLKEKDSFTTILSFQLAQ